MNIDLSVSLKPNYPKSAYHGLNLVFVLTIERFILGYVMCHVCVATCVVLVPLN